MRKKLQRQRDGKSCSLRSSPLHPSAAWGSHLLQSSSGKLSLFISHHPSDPPNLTHLQRSCYFPHTFNPNSRKFMLSDPSLCCRRCLQMVINWGGWRSPGCSDSLYQEAGRWRLMIVSRSSSFSLYVGWFPHTFDISVFSEVNGVLLFLDIKQYVCLAHCHCNLWAFYSKMSKH